MPEEKKEMSGSSTSGMLNDFIQKDNFGARPRANEVSFLGFQLDESNELDFMSANRDPRESKKEEKRHYSRGGGGGRHLSENNRI